MKIIDISEEQVERAKNLYPFDELKNSITKGKGNLLGAVGEIVVFDVFTAKGCEVDFNSTVDYDLIIDGYKVDVKSKATNYKPLESFNCSIPAFNTSQKCDFYFFTYITYDYKRCYLAGYKRKNTFFKEAYFANKGEIDYGEWKYKSDCYNLKMGRLNKFIVIVLIIILIN